LAHDRLRAWLALVTFAALYVASTHLEPFIARPMVHVLAGLLGPFARAGAHEVPPQLLIGLCITRIVLIVAILQIAAWIDGRPAWSYGLEQLRMRDALHGLAAGFLGVTLVVGALCLTGHLRVSISVGDIASRVAFALIWGFGMILVGLSEELQFRGLPVLVLRRLSSAPVACAVSAAAFMLVHLLNNSDETPAGLVQIALFGAVAALSVLVTRSLMWCIAFHASWDWTLETFFGAIGSGYRFHGALLKVDAVGPAWITGGSAGLEGSVFAIAILGLALAGGVAWYARSPQRRRLH
jgi:uncharacterized protein